MLEQYLFSFSEGKPNVILDGVFTQKTSGLPRDRATFNTVGDAAYTFSGIANGALTSSMQRYNFLTDTWENITSVNPPSARYGCASVTIGNKIYVFGGFTNAVQATTYVFDPSNLTWTRLADMPAGRYYTTAVAIGGKAYIYGGLNGSTPQSTVFEYNPSTDTWDTLTVSIAAGNPGARHAHGACVVDGELHIFSGVRSSTMLSDHFALNVGSKAWRYVGTTPFSRTYMATAAFDRRIYTFGGSQNNTTAINNFYKYFRTDGWSSMPTQPTARYTAMMTIWNNKAWMYGGMPTGTGSVSLGELWMIE